MHAELLVHDVRVFDGETVLEGRDVLVAGGVIRQVRPAVDVDPGDGGARAIDGRVAVDGRGRTLLPGLFDAHLHLPPAPEDALRQLAAHGVTTALDMFCGGDILTSIRRIASADPPDLADPHTCGTGATAPGNVFERMIGRPLPTLDGPGDAAGWVDARLAEGSEFIKVVYDARQGGPLDLATVTAIVAEAHRREALVVVHALTERTAREAVAAGADGLVHLFLGETVGADFGRFVAEHGAFVIPTLTVLRGLCGARPPAPDRGHLFDAAPQALLQLASAGVTVLAGTDTAPATAPLGVFPYGATLHGELELLVRSGLPTVPALVAATSAPARAFRLVDRGFVRPGFRADLVLVDGDPTRDIRATRDIVAVWKRGRQVPVPVG